MALPTCAPQCWDWPICEHRDPSGQSWTDRHGDVWVEGPDGRLWTKETRPFDREHVERKWGPLREVEVPGAKA